MATYAKQLSAEFPKTAHDQVITEPKAFWVPLGLTPAAADAIAPTTRLLAALARLPDKCADLGILPTKNGASIQLRIKRARGATYSQHFQCRLYSCDGDGHTQLLANYNGDTLVTLTCDNTVDQDDDGTSRWTFVHPTIHTWPIFGARYILVERVTTLTGANLGTIDLEAKLIG